MDLSPLVSLIFFYLFGVWRKSGKKFGKSGKPIPLNPYSKKVTIWFLFFQILCPKCEKQ